VRRDSTARKSRLPGSGDRARARQQANERASPDDAELRRGEATRRSTVHLHTHRSVRSRSGNRVLPFAAATSRALRVLADHSYARPARGRRQATQSDAVNPE